MTAKKILFEHEYSPKLGQQITPCFPSPSDHWYYSLIFSFSMIIASCFINVLVLELSQTYIIQNKFCKVSKYWYRDFLNRDFFFRYRSVLRLVNSKKCFFNAISPSFIYSLSVFCVVLYSPKACSCFNQFCNVGIFYLYLGTFFSFFGKLKILGWLA